jgi:hypothetical protein
MKEFNVIKELMNEDMAGTVKTDQMSTQNFH